MRGFILAIAVLLLPIFASAQDGLPSGQTFELPIIVGGKPAIGKALISEASTAEKPLLVFYVGTDGKVGVMAYFVRRADSQPNPRPNPDPQPQPKPNPNKVAYLYWIHESKASTPAQAVVRDDKTWRDAADGYGVRWLVLDVDEAAKKFPVAATKAKAAGLPALVWLDSQGIAEAATPPKTAAELIAELARRAK